MRSSRRRRRTADERASPDWVRSVFGHLVEAYPHLSPYKDKDLVRLARAVRHVERYAASDTRRGRPSRWPREGLVKLGSRLSDILARETGGRVSLATFVDHYLRVLDFPSDVLEALKKGAVNLFEAEQLARITPKRLGITSLEAKLKRADILSVHLRARASGAGLRRRVDELIRTESAGRDTSSLSPDETDQAEGGTLESLEDFDPYDTTHLFWEEVKQLGFAFRDIRREDLTEELIEELLKASQPLWGILAKIQRRKGSNRSEQSGKKVMV